MNRLSEKVTEFIGKLGKVSKMTIGADMSREVTFRAGGTAAVLVEPSNIEELSEILKLIHQINVPFFIMGNGSNLLVKDQGFNGVIVKISGQAFDFIDISSDETTVTVGSGVLMGKLSRFLTEHSLSGFEFASGIPGTIGGAVFMNAGAYGGEIKNVLISAKMLAKNGERVYTLTNEELGFSYRNSVLQQTGDVVLEATFKFEKGNKEEIKEKIKDFTAQRREKQPINYPSAGSTFKSPEGYFAAKLIQDAGLKGFSVGGAEVSTLHSGFVINKGGAKASDILDVMEHVKTVIKKEYGVELEPEVRILGDD